MTKNKFYKVLDLRNVFILPDHDGEDLQQFLNSQDLENYDFQTVIADRYLVFLLNETKEQSPASQFLNDILSQVENHLDEELNEEDLDRWMAHHGAN